MIAMRPRHSQSERGTGCRRREGVGGCGQSGHCRFTQRLCERSRSGARHVCCEPSGESAASARTQQPMPGWPCMAALRLQREPARALRRTRICPVGCFKTVYPRPLPVLLPSGIHGLRTSLHGASSLRPRWHLLVNGSHYVE